MDARVSGPLPETESVSPVGLAIPPERRRILLSPINRRRWENFKANKRGYWSLWIFLILFFQILVLVRDSAAGLRPELIQSVRSLGAGRRALFRYVYLPASLPAVLTALRQSVGTAVAVLYVAELFATQRGLGYYIYLNGSTLFNYPAMYGGVVMMSLLGLGLYFGVDLLERRLCPWKTAA